MPNLQNAPKCMPNSQNVMHCGSRNNGMLRNDLLPYLGTYILSHFVIFH